VILLGDVIPAHQKWKDVVRIMALNGSQAAEQDMLMRL
jgi:hypothetical protein